MEPISIGKLKINICKDPVPLQISGVFCGITSLLRYRHWFKKGGGRGRWGLSSSSGGRVSPAKPVFCQLHRANSLKDISDSGYSSAIPGSWVKLSSWLSDYSLAQFV